MSSFATNNKNPNILNKRKKIINIMEEPFIVNDFLLCSHYGCNTKYRKKDEFSENKLLMIAPMNEDEKFWAILESIEKTKLFCMDHALKHATTICANSKIIYED